MDTSHKKHPTCQERSFFKLKALGTGKTHEAGRSENP